MALPPVHTEQRFTIRPTYIVSTSIYSGGKGIRSKAQRATEANLSNRDNKGVLSLKAAKKVRNAINWLVHSAKFKRVYSKLDSRHYWFKVNFITLTIPYSEGTEITGKRTAEMLHTWMAYARKYFHLHNYVWKIERGLQGKLHIHLTTDTFIHYLKLRSSWNRVLQSNGLLENYYKANGHYNANSTDVHAVRKIKNLAGYLAAYMAKGSELGKDFKNRIWGCNVNLSEGNKCSYIADLGELSDVTRSLFHRDIRWKSLHSKPNCMGSVRNVGEIFFLNEGLWKAVMSDQLRYTYDSHIKRIQDDTPKLPFDYLQMN